MALMINVAANSERTIAKLQLGDLRVDNQAQDAQFVTVDTLKVHESAAARAYLVVDRESALYAYLIRGAINIRRWRYESGLSVRRRSCSTR